MKTHRLIIIIAGAAIVLAVPLTGRAQTPADAPAPPATAPAPATGAAVTQPASDSAADQATRTDPQAHADTLASLRRALGQLVGPTGAPRAASDPVHALLTDLAAQAGELAELATAPDLELAARQLEARARYSLLRHAHEHASATTVSFRLIQLRAVVESIAAIDHPVARRVADYWGLLAELVELERNPDALDQVQSRLVSRLQAPANHQAAEDGPADAAPPDAEARRIDAAHFWAVLQLCDQLGWSETLCARVQSDAAAAHLTPADRARPAWRQYQAVCDRLGTPVKLTVQTDRGAWALPGPGETFVVIALHSGRVPAGWAEQMQRAEQAGVRAVEVVVRRDEASGEQVGERDDGQHDEQEDVAMAGVWPRVTEAASVRAAVAELGVMTLPRVVVIDARGRYALSGVTAQVIERAVELASERAAKQRENAP